jgi:hypothetical protein
LRGSQEKPKISFVRTKYDFKLQLERRTQENIAISINAILKVTFLKIAFLKPVLFKIT